MNAPASEGTSGSEVARVQAGEDTSFRRQLAMMRQAFTASPVRNRILAVGAATVFVVIATSAGQVVLNRWNKPFYDAIERRDLEGFAHQLLVFGAIASVLLVLNVMQEWLAQLLHLRLREGLTRDLIGEWMRPRRAVRLANAGAIGVNPDQRVHEDAHHLADLSADLGVGLLQSTILLFSFVGVLWAISAGFVFHIDGRSFAIPGYMVWAAVLYAGAASCLSWLAGRPLIGLNSELYGREAALRFSLVRVSEHAEAISLAGGEADEEHRLGRDLASVLDASRAIIRAVVRLTWVTAGYGWITVVAPIVIASPVYFAGDMSFGGLMMAAAAFTQVHAALRWFVDHISAIADWRATLLRVAAFRAALVETDEPASAGGGIARGTSEARQMVFDGLVLASPEGATRLSEPHVVVAPGERVAVTGEPGQGKTLFFMALAGLWTKGSGWVGLPQGQDVAFVPATPYFPPGTLAEVLAYPQPEQGFDRAAAAAALRKVGLDRLEDRLERDARWDHELSEDEQRLLAFARLALQRPDWIVIDEALDALPGDARDRVLALLEDELARAAVVAIGRSERPGQSFTRSLKLVPEQQRLAAGAPGSEAGKPSAATEKSRKAGFSSAV